MNELNRILEQHGLHRNSVYLLELIPLIDMIWSDGRNQAQEVAILQRFATRHLANLRRNAEGLEVVSAQKANAFIEYFMNARPSPSLLADLKSLALQRLVQQGDQTAIDSVIHHCMDIAAACVLDYPYAAGGRIMAEEKTLLLELIAELELPQSLAV
jgi:hypothetical protein